MRHVALAVDVIAGGIKIRHGIAEYARQFGPWRFTTIGGSVTGGGVDAVARPNIAEMRELKVEGVIGQIWDEAKFADFVGSEIPVVDVSNGRLRGPFPKILLDNAGAGRSAAEYLLGQGLRQFAVFSNYWSHGFELRAESFRERVEQTRKASCKVFRLPRRPDPSPAEEERFFDAALASLPRPVGVYAVTDLQAAKLLVSARKIGLRVPDDLAVIGTDNAVEVCDLTDPELSSVELNLERIGYEAAKLLGGLMAGGGVPENNPVIPVGQIVARASTDVLAIEDDDVVTAARYIRRHANGSISVRDVLKEVPLSRRMLERRFRSAMGHCIHDEIQRVRLERVKKLLAETDMTMLDIALAAGFTSQSYFGRAFARSEGLTPSRYRRERRNPT